MVLPSLWYFLSFLAFCQVALGRITVDREKRIFMDENKRTRIFHGVNAVYKIPPYYPTTTGFDSTSTLSEVDALVLRSWGFNIVRLGVMWPGLEPSKQGEFNNSYLDQIEVIVDNLGKEGIAVILDFHQDIWHRKFCGEGVPDYVYEMCKSSEPAGTPAFPLPAVNASYPVDSEGNPTLDACLSKMFATYYLSAEVGAGFQCLYDNKNNVWDAFAGYWMAVAKRFSGTENVLGYELINEPWAGDVYQSPKNLLPRFAEKHLLEPMYKFLHAKIRSVDDEKIIFFEGLTIDYWQNGFSAGPGGEAYNDRQALAYHVYCPLSDPDVKKVMACSLIDDWFFSMRVKDTERLGVAMIMTEFGAAKDVPGDLSVVRQVVDLADRFQQSWMYWQLKYYQDITTVTPEGESLYNSDGTPNKDKLLLLSRTYPFAVAGSLEHYEYNVLSKKYEMQITPLSSAAFEEVKENALARTSEVFVNLESSYPHGLSITLSPDNIASSFSASCPGKRAQSSDYSLVKIVQNAGVDSSSDGSAPQLTVEIKPCTLLNISQCTCK